MTQITFLSAPGLPSSGPLGLSSFYSFVAFPCERLILKHSSPPLHTQRTEPPKPYEQAAAAALISVQAELAFARAELLSLQQRVTSVESSTQQSREEVLRRRMMEREHAPMLQSLRIRANAALGAICHENAPHPHSDDYASHLLFFPAVVTRLENRSERARVLVEERSRGLLKRAFSRVFSHLQNTYPNFDFDATIAPVPEAIRGDLARWV